MILELAVDGLERPSPKPMVETPGDPPSHARRMKEISSVATKDASCVTTEEVSSKVSEDAPSAATEKMRPQQRSLL